MAVAGDWMDQEQCHKHEKKYLMGDVEHIEVVQNLQRKTTPLTKLILACASLQLEVIEYCS